MKEPTTGLSGRKGDRIATSEMQQRANYSETNTPLPFLPLSCIREWAETRAETGRLITEELY